MRRHRRQQVWVPKVGVTCRSAELLCLELSHELSYGFCPRFVAYPRARSRERKYAHSNASGGPSMGNSIRHGDAVNPAPSGWVLALTSAGPFEWTIDRRSTEYHPDGVPPINRTRRHARTAACRRSARTVPRKPTLRAIRVRGGRTEPRCGRRGGSGQQWSAADVDHRDNGVQGDFEGADVALDSGHEQTLEWTGKPSRHESQ